MTNKMIALGGCCSGAPYGFNTLPSRLMRGAAAGGGGGPGFSGGGRAFMGGGGPGFSGGGMRSWEAEDAPSAEADAAFMGDGGRAFSGDGRAFIGGRDGQSPWGGPPIGCSRLRRSSKPAFRSPSPFPSSTRVCRRAVPLRRLLRLWLRRWVLLAEAQGALHRQPILVEPLLRLHQRVRLLSAKHSAMALAPLIIRGGPSASGDCWRSASARDEGKERRFSVRLDGAGDRAAAASNARGRAALREKGAPVEGAPRKPSV